MKPTTDNFCVRCGKPRITLKTWSQKIGNSTVIITQTVCPNSECQKKVEAENKKKSDIRSAAKLESKQRIIDRNKLRFNSRQKIGNK